jgi:exonuclease III
VCQYDVLLFTETWQATNSVCEIDGYKCYAIPRISCNMRSTRQRDSWNRGGVSIYVRTALEKGVKVVSTNAIGIVWVKLDKVAFNFVEDVFLGLTYIPPQNSTFYHAHDVDFFDVLQHDCSKYSSDGCVVLCGDFNARVSNKADYILAETGIERVVRQAENLVTNTNLPVRVSCDVHSNAFGSKLLDLCKSTGLCIVNGRTGKDGSKGEFTCYASRGSSVVDYVLTSADNFVLIKDFFVCEPTPHSDHAPLHLSLACSSHGAIQEEINSPRVTVECLRWKQEGIPAFRELVTSKLPDLQTIVSSLNQSVISVDSAVASVTDILYDSAFSVCGKTLIKGGVSTNREKYAHSQWFDESCKLEKHSFRKAVSDYNVDRSEVTRQQLVIGRRRYNRAKRLAKEKFNVRERAELSNLAKNSPKSFWKHFKKNKSKVGTSSSPTLDEFHAHFKDVLGGDKPLVSDEANVADENYNTVDMLDTAITLDEVLTAISLLKRNKSSGTDKVISEMFIDASDLLAPVLADLFNYMFDNNVFPETWSTGIIVPIPKKGNTSDANNYRGITITSTFSKIFSIVLNTRLKFWAEGNDVLNDAQFGFRCNRSTTDSVFVLQSIITTALAQRKKLFCAFIDFKKAFDLVERSFIWQKLIEFGVSTKMVKMLSSMYESVKCCVKHCNSMSDFFDSYVGVKQGEPLSPILFLMFINDISDSLQVDQGVIEQLAIFSILFADDTVLIARSHEELQVLLSKLHGYCSKWNITVNIDKTKIVVFKKGNHPTHYNWYFNNCIIEVVTYFTYLGSVLSANGSFVQTQRALAHQAKRSVFALNSILSKRACDVKTEMYLFDAMITPILAYDAEIWDFMQFLTLKTFTFNFVLYVCSHCTVLYNVNTFYSSF